MNSLDIIYFYLTAAIVLTCLGFLGYMAIRWTQDWLRFRQWVKHHSQFKPAPKPDLPESDPPNYVLVKPGINQEYQAQLEAAQREYDEKLNGVWRPADDSSDGPSAEDAWREFRKTPDFYDVEFIDEITPVQPGDWAKLEALYRMKTYRPEDKSNES